MSQGHSPARLGACSSWAGTWRRGTRGPLRLSCGTLGGAGPGSCRTEHVRGTAARGVPEGLGALHTGCGAGGLGGWERWREAAMRHMTRQGRCGMWPRRVCGPGIRDSGRARRHGGGSCDSRRRARTSLACIGGAPYPASAARPVPSHTPTHAGTARVYGARGTARVGHGAGLRQRQRPGWSRQESSLQESARVGTSRADSGGRM